MTYPLIGNYGINEEDKQSYKLHLESLIVHEYLDCYSNFRAKIVKYLEENNILGVEGIDTRRITRQLRHVGAMNALLTTSDDSDESLIKKVQEFEGIEHKNLALEVTTKETYQWQEPDQIKCHVAVIDSGVKYNILNQLKNVGCKVTVFPCTVTADEILSQSFDGVLVSNGPGNPEAVTSVIKTVQELAGKIPLFGICLGHQILCHAFGFKLTKLPFGHHGVNHPIKHLFTDRIEITSQNHIYCAEKSTVPENFVISHMNQNDHTVAGIRSDELMAFSVQYHPEAAPGPNDSHYLFEEFVYLMKNRQFSISQPIPVEVDNA